MVDSNGSEVTLFTIGHSNHGFDRWVGLLRRWTIAVVADIRSQPYSRWAPHFGKEELQRALAAHPIGYWYLGAELGGKREIGYAAIAATDEFRKAIGLLMEAAGRQRIALMCAEEDPRRCHRHLLASPALTARGARVFHLRGDGSVEDEEDLAPPRLFS